MLFPDTIGKTRSRHQEDQHDRIEHEHASGDDRLQLQHHEHERNQNRAQRRREHDALHIEDAREAPQSPVKTECQEYRRLQRQNPDERAPRVADVRIVYIEVEAQPEDRHPCERRSENVVDEGERRAPIEAEGHGGVGLFLRQ